MCFLYLLSDFLICSFVGQIVSVEKEIMGILKRQKICCDYPRVITRSGVDGH